MGLFLFFLGGGVIPMAATAIAFIIGAAVGFVGHKWLETRRATSGTIIINYSDPDGPYAFMALDEPIDVLARRKGAKFRVHRQ